MKKIFYFLSLALLAAGCDKEKHEPVKKEGSAPGRITNVQVQNEHGAARISYSLPENKDLLYVKAVYETRTGKPREVKSSFYNNFLVVDGFGDTRKHTIKLYAVSRSEVHSEPVEVEVEPKTPPVALIRNSFVIREDFGGINITFTNNTKAEVAIIVMTKDSLGNMQEANIRYTKAQGGNYSLRGYDAVDREFKLFVRDHYGNYSDTLTGSWTPYFERRLDITKFKEVILPGDVDDGWEIYPIPNLWNGTMWHSANKFDGMPMWFTFDMGVVAQLSRISMWQRPNEWLYMQNNVREFEVWGIENTPPADGSWDGWHKLVSHTLLKPSKMPIGQLSQEDRDKGKDGEHIDVPLQAPRVRYIRIKILRTWTDGGYAANIQEMRFFGNDR